jgi:uncharacterized protein with FMN-binding domain
MRRAVAALVVTTVAVVLLARYETEPPVTVDRSVARARPTPRAFATAEPMRSTIPGGKGRVVSADGPAMTTPFSVIQVRATLTGGKLTGVETLALSGDGPHTEALNARAEPILREEALKAGSADIDVVSGATSSSQIWIDSLRGAIREARRAG